MPDDTSHLNADTKLERKLKTMLRVKYINVQLLLERNNPNGHTFMKAFNAQKAGSCSFEDKGKT